MYDVDIFPNRPVARFEKGKAYTIPLDLKPDVLIFDNATLHEIDKAYYTLIKQQAYNATAKYIFIVDLLYSKLIDFVASNYLVNTIFIGMRTRKIITIAPYEQYKVEHKRVNSTLLVESGFCDDQYSLHRNFFPFKNYRNWRKRTITIVYLPTEAYSRCGKCKKPGISIEFITLILKHLNIPHEFLRRSFKTIEDIMKRHDFSFGALVLKPPVIFDMNLIFDGQLYSDPMHQFHLEQEHISNRFHNCDE
ncbi:hypothetical protein WA026_018511 [Henosepilachna vigintioctopunctata]|uniref:Uncharacterized protein n=1 Tax=Henosepilachna vigintioctopunctata TaxID=420089 RepID=A0AAW1V3J4_9CUCU